MKFFTLDVYKEEDSSKPFAAAMAAYNEHLAALRGVLPDDLLTLAHLPGVDDGLVVKVHHVRRLKALQLTLRCGGLPMGYFDLVLNYEGIELSPQTAWTLARIARTTKSDSRHEHDVAYHEIDRSEAGGVTHRFLFHPGVLVQFSCQCLRWEKIARPDRTLPSLPDRFPEGPKSAAYGARKRRLRAAPSRR